MDVMTWFEFNGYSVEAEFLGNRVARLVQYTVVEDARRPRLAMILCRASPQARAWSVRLVAGWDYAHGSFFEVWGAPARQDIVLAEADRAAGRTTMGAVFPSLDVLGWVAALATAPSTPREFRDSFALVPPAAAFLQLPLLGESAQARFGRADEKLA